MSVAHFFIHLSLDGHLDCVLPPGYRGQHCWEHGVNGISRDPEFSSFSYRSRSEMVGPYAHSIFLACKCLANIGFFSQVLLCSPGWSRTEIFLPPIPDCWDGRHATQQPDVHVDLEEFIHCFHSS